MIFPIYKKGDLVTYKEKEYAIVASWRVPHKSKMDGNTFDVIHYTIKSVNIINKEIKDVMEFSLHTNKRQKRNNKLNRLDI